MKTHPEGVDRDVEIQVIGVELALLVPASSGGQLEEEIEMVAMKRTLPLLPPGAWGTRRPQMKVTVHTSDGDRQATITL